MVMSLGQLKTTYNTKKQKNKKPAHISQNTANTISVYGAERWAYPCNSFIF